MFQVGGVKINSLLIIIFNGCGKVREGGERDSEGLLHMECGNSETRVFTYKSENAHVISCLPFFDL